MKTFSKYLTISLLIFTLIPTLSACKKSEPEQKEIPIEKVETNIIEEKTEDVEKLKISYIDLDDGNATLIQLTNGKNILIDTGDDTHSETLMNTLDSYNIQKVDYLIGTHSHKESIGGFKNLMVSKEIVNIVLPQIENDNIEDLLSVAEENNISIIQPTVGETIYSDFSTRLLVLAPNSSSYKNPDNNSLVLKLLYKDKTFLFQGDAGKTSEEEILATNVDIKASVIRLANYGKDTATTKAYIKKVRPQYAIISTDRNEEETTPSKATMDLLRENNIKVYETDLYGTIDVITDGDTIEISYKGNENAPPSVHIYQSEKKESTDIEDFAPYSVIEERVYIIDGTTTYHSSDCEELIEQDYYVRSVSEIEELKLTPCSKCNN